jgi:hypothetical protein
MGNRGCLHDAEQRVRRAFDVKRWIICLLEFKGRRRRLMVPGRYTELFFLDEATALAAGHRPCAECQRQRYLTFREHWAPANAVGGVPSAAAIDEALHAERLDRQGKRTYTERLSRLPSGVMVADDVGRAHLWLSGVMRAWAPSGYEPPLARSGDGEVRVLTPPSIVRAIARGYAVRLHGSALG